MWTFYDCSECVLSFLRIQLLVGIKDTNEQLVSVTLRALADLIPVLGAAAVIGGKRAKLFTDGRPKVS
jgi:SCY1-like protein 3